MTAAQQSKIHFPGLNGLRFWAAFAVIIHHVEQNKFWLQKPNVWGNPVIDALGHMGVSFFFVLSGFLITYLLLAELHKTGTVSIRKFYIRRTLRIWPLYFLIIGFTCFVLPALIDFRLFGTHFAGGYPWEIICLYLLILPNVARLSAYPVLGANQTWSVGIEEQFYILWPVLIFLFRKMLLPFLVLFLIVKMGIGMSLAMIHMYLPLSPGMDKLISQLLAFWNMFMIEQMVIGAIGAYFLFYKRKKCIKWMYHPFCVAGAILIWIPLVFYGKMIPAHALIEGIIFLVIILNVSTNPEFPVKLSHPLYDRLGNYSYGIYMFHTIVIALTAQFIIKSGIGQKDLVQFNFLLYAVSIMLTILISALSYHYFESGFLKLKKRFMVVQSQAASPGDSGMSVEAAATAPRVTA